MSTMRIPTRQIRSTPILCWRWFITLKIVFHPPIHRSFGRQQDLAWRRLRETGRWEHRSTCASPCIKHTDSTRHEAIEFWNYFDESDYLVVIMLNSCVIVLLCCFAYSSAQTYNKLGYTDCGMCQRVRTHHHSPSTASHRFEECSNQSIVVLPNAHHSTRCRQDLSFRRNHSKNPRCDQGWCEHPPYGERY